MLCHSNTDVTPETSLLQSKGRNWRHVTVTPCNFPPDCPEREDKAKHIEPDCSAPVKDRELKFSGVIPYIPGYPTVLRLS